MDVDFKTPHHENGDKNDEALPQKTPPDVETNGTTKDNSPKHSLRQKKGQRRSRSRTPQKKADETKSLQVTLKKIDKTLNGKEVKEETEKTEDKNDDDKVRDEEVSEEKVVKEQAVKEGNDKTDLNKKEKQSKKQKEVQLRKEENKKKDDPQETNELPNVEETVKKSPKKEKKEKTKKQELSQTNETETEPVEMDPLVISDEPDPELQFDENSDMESGKGSPVISRCVTRRSQTRNIPTPKTPKSVDQDIDSEKNSITHTPTDLDTDLPKTDNLNDSQDSSDTANLSTVAEVGSDVTRMDYIETHKSNVTDDTSYLNASRERSLSETLRCLSARRPIRSTDDYRRRVLKSNQERSDLNLPYPPHNSVEQIKTGLKRKSRSTTPEDRKKFKFESPGLNSLLSSPLASLRNKFKSDLPSSTPKLLGYRDNRSDLYYNTDHLEGVDNGDDEKKSWCSIM